MEINFANTYTVDVGAQTISPDPVTSTSEIAFQVLVSRKAALMVYAGEYRGASNRAINFKDGPSTIDSRGVAEAKKSLLGDAQLGYDKARVAYLTGDGMRGKGIVTPFNIGMVETTGTTRDVRTNWS